MTKNGRFIKISPLRRLSKGRSGISRKC